jgi:hypothetical protein
MAKRNIAFLFEKVLKLDKLEFHLLKNLANSNRLIIIFDGFDEVLDYKDKLIDLIEKLRNININLNKIILTSREDAKKELQDKFQTFSYKMKKFEENDQIEFLTNYWKNLETKLSEECLRSTAENIIKNLNDFISKNSNCI